MAEKFAAMLDGTVPWQVVKSLEGAAGVLDANGRPLFVAPGPIARRIVAAVNQVEASFRDTPQRNVCGND